MKHPMQPIVLVDGVARFKENKIVSWLLDNGPFGMNAIAMQKFDQDDRAQFAQLVGYSVAGAGDLSYMDDALIVKADDIVDKMFKHKEKKMKKNTHKTIHDNLPGTAVELIRAKRKAAQYLQLLHEEFDHLMQKHRDTGDNAAIERAKYLFSRIQQIEKFGE